jgi:hypothetical protein
MGDTVPANRLPLMMLAPIAVTYEHAMTENEGRNTWRTDRYSPCPRQEAASYLTFLASLGYQLSAIEQAIATMTPYTGETPAGDPITSEPGELTPGEQDPARPELDSEGGDSAGDPPAKRASPKSPVRTTAEPVSDDLEDAA